MSQDPFEPLPAESPFASPQAECSAPPPAVPEAPRKAFPGMLWSLGLLAILFGLQIAGGIAVAVVSVIVHGMKGPQQDTNLLAAGMVVIQLLSFSPVLYLGQVLARRPWREMYPFRGFTPLVLLPILVAVAGMSVLVSECDNLLRMVLPMPSWIADLFKQLSDGGIWSILALVVMAPLTEELLFRGLILQGFVPRYGSVAAVLLSAFLFAAFHLNPYQFAPAMLTGVFLGWIFLRTGSLWPCITLHALYNGHIVLVPLLPQLGIRIRGYTESPDPKVVQLQPVWFDALGISLVLLAALGIALTTRRPSANVVSDCQIGVARP